MTTASVIQGFAVTSRRPALAADHAGLVALVAPGQESDAALVDAGTENREHRRQHRQRQQHDADDGAGRRQPHDGEERDADHAAAPTAR